MSYVLGGRFIPRFTMLDSSDSGFSSFNLELDANTGLIGTLDTDERSFLLDGTLTGNLVAAGMGLTETVTVDVEMLYSNLTFETIGDLDFWVARDDSVSSGSISGNMLGEDFSFDLTGKFLDITDETSVAAQNRFPEFLNTGPFSAALGALSFNPDGAVVFESWIMGTGDDVQIGGTSFSLGGDFHNVITAENPEPATVLLFLLGLGFLLNKRRQDNLVEA